MPFKPLLEKRAFVSDGDFISFCLLLLTAFHSAHSAGDICALSLSVKNIPGSLVSWFQLG